MLLREPAIYLDHNATTPLLPEVVDAMLPLLREHHGNPSSDHVYGRRARTALEEARARVAALIGARADEVVFTSGGTESNNLAIRGVAAALSGRRQVVTSTIEHPATVEPCRTLEAAGWTVRRVGVGGDGRVRAEDVLAALGTDTALVTLMHSNNETGVLQPIVEVARAGRARGVIVHTDAAQSVGKVRVGVNDLAVDLLSIAGHKLYAPKGVGALYVRSGTPLRPLLVGAGQERGLRPGTENVASIVGLGAACEIAHRTCAGEAARVSALRDDLWERLRAAIPGMARNGDGDGAGCLPNTLNVSFPGVSGRRVLEGAPEIAASTGSACHAGHESPSGVLLAMGLDVERALGAVRLSLGRSTTTADVEQAARVLVRAWRRGATSAGRPPSG